MNKPLMPKATALWLTRHTLLSIEQIADFCGFHPLQIRALADNEKGTLQAVNPLLAGQLTSEEIARCEADATATLALRQYVSVVVKKRRKYTPLSKRSEMPSAVLWLIKNMPQLSDVQICKLLSTTKNTVQSIRENRHRDMKELSPHDPVLLGLCTQEELGDAVQKAIKTSL